MKRAKEGKGAEVEVKGVKGRMEGNWGNES